MKNLDHRTVGEEKAGKNSYNSGISRFLSKLGNPKREHAVVAKWRYKSLCNSESIIMFVANIVSISRGRCTLLPMQKRARREKLNGSITVRREYIIDLGAEREELRITLSGKIKSWSIKD